MTCHVDTISEGVGRWATVWCHKIHDEIVDFTTGPKRLLSNTCLVWVCLGVLSLLYQRVWGRMCWSVWFMEWMVSYFLLYCHSVKICFIWCQVTFEPLLQFLWLQAKEKSRSDGISWDILLILIKGHMTNQLSYSCTVFKNKQRKIFSNFSLLIETVDCIWVVDWASLTSPVKNGFLPVPMK